MKAIAEAHGESVEARAEDAGATFVLKIPARESAIYGRSVGDLPVFNRTAPKWR